MLANKPAKKQKLWIRSRSPECQIPLLKLLFSIGSVHFRAHIGTLSFGGLNGELLTAYLATKNKKPIVLPSIIGMVTILGVESLWILVTPLSKKTSIPIPRFESDAWRIIPAAVSNLG